jgi:hypothetical protein
MWMRIIFVAAFAAASPAHAADWRITGFGALESRLFVQGAAPPVTLPAGRVFPADHDTSQSVVLQPEFSTTWNDRRDAFSFVPFVRLDQRDDERTHVDIRELTWLRAGRTWELRAGIRKVFWGVTESRHLVDIINQTDQVENIDGEDKLGQPMVNLALIRDWGTVDLFVMPYFRERTFAGEDGRLRAVPRVEADRARYESGAEENHVDVAARWSHYIGNWDIGVSYFRGTSREPRLVPDRTAAGETVLAPVYDQIRQAGIDLQYTRGSWLWKLEGIHRSGHEGEGADDFIAAVGGFEYTFYGLFDSAMDLGVLAEYLYDDRSGAPGTPFDDDLFTGLRLTLNDAQSTETLVGCVSDLDTSARFCSAEASRRFGDSWVLSLEARVFMDVPRADPLFNLRRDDYLQLELAYHF